MATGREYALARPAEEPLLPLRRLRAKPTGRGVRGGYGALWCFVHAEEFSFGQDRPSVRNRAV